MHTSRTPLVLSISADDGATWNSGPTLESDPGEYSYPAIIQAASGEIHVTYTWKRKRYPTLDSGPQYFVTSNTRDMKEE
jgi:predicted neuraminidase